ncbi:MFS transporter [Bifidobacterium boum]|uniref:MFS transporter n=1 Tax=Bifidobacterium boum TaxID=78343 RepID=UPI001F45004E|nr:MFS transporter [Bifidobacterium boum]MCF2561024.1 MFS transporter [Bifidobacterium boum]
MPESTQQQPKPAGSTEHNPDLRPANRDTADSPVPWRTRAAIASIGMLSFVGILTETSMTVDFPVLIRSMHVPLTTVQWLTTGYLLLVTIVMGSTAYLLKRFNPRALFFFALATSIIGSLICLVAPGFALLLFGRMLQAIATGIATPLMFQTIFTQVPVRKLGVYTGFAAVIISLAPALGPSYGGIMTSVWSWRAIFVGVLPLLVCIGIAGSFTIHGTAPGVAGQRFDVIGLTVLSCVFLGLLVTFNEAGRGGWLSPRFWIGLLVVLALIAVMVWHARHGARRLFDYSILDNRIVRLRLFSYFGMQFINIGISIVFPLYVQDVLGDSAMTAGLMLLPGSLIGSFAAPFAGQAYDRSGLRRPITVSITLMVLALGLLTGFAESLTVVLTGIFYTLLRIGFNIGFGITMSDASKYVAPRQKSDQNSLFSMMQQFAGSLGTAVMSAVIAAQTLRMPVSSATVSGSRIDFIILLVLALAIGACVAISFRVQREA